MYCFRRLFLPSLFALLIIGCSDSTTNSGFVTYEVGEGGLNEGDRFSVNFNNGEFSCGSSEGSCDVLTIID